MKVYLCERRDSTEPTGWRSFWSVRCESQHLSDLLTFCKREYKVLRENWDDFRFRDCGFITEAEATWEFDGTRRWEVNKKYGDEFGQRYDVDDHNAARDEAMRQADWWKEGGEPPC